MPRISDKVESYFREIIMISESREKEIKTLTDFITSNPDPRELKRALAIKLALEGYAYRAIKQSLGVSYGFISKWKTSFEAWGISGIKLAHKGSQSFLTEEQIEQVITWLFSQNHWDISELEVYLIDHYDVVFQSPQSYYALLKKNLLWSLKFNVSGLCSISLSGWKWGMYGRFCQEITGKK
jgi:transposase